jgi:hypothetical protein
MKKKQSPYKAILQMAVKARTPADFSALKMSIKCASLSDTERQHLDDRYDACLWNVQALGMKADEWIARIMKIKDKHVRAKVASLIWWDYASQHREVFPLILQYNRFEVDDESDVCRELIAIGYPSRLATRRSRQPKDSHYNPGAV